MNVQKVDIKEIQLIGKKELKNNDAVKALDNYIRMITGLDDISISVKIDSLKSAIIKGEILDFCEIVQSWCTYYNSTRVSNYILNNDIIDSRTIKIIVEERDSIVKHICYSNDGVSMYKLFSKHTESDGRYKESAIGYIIEKENKDNGDIETIGLYRINEKLRAKKAYKRSIKDKKDIKLEEK